MTDSPVLRLPFELTSRTFCLCLPRHRRVRPRRNAPPLQLGQVCRQWREVALATPELWRAIAIGFSVEELQYDGLATLFGEPERESTQWDPAAALDLWLTRSSPLSVSVSLCCYDFLPSSMISILASHSRRWERLELILSTEDLLELTHTPGPFPLLQNLFVRVLTDGLRPMQIRDFLRNAPMLSVLDARGCLVQDILSAECPLTGLHLDHEVRMSGSSGWTEVFEAFPNLLHFGAYGTGSSMIWTPSFDPVQPFTQIPPLTTLILQGGPQFLDNLTIPSLRHLSVDIFDAIITPAIPIFADHVQKFIVRSGCKLDTLTLGVPECPENSDVSGELTLFLAVPTLSTLELQLWRDTDDDIDAGFADARYRLLQTPGILPNLETLIIADLDPFAKSQGYRSFFDAVRARNTLRSAELHILPYNYYRPDIVPPPPAWVMSDLKEFSAVDVRIRISAPTFQLPAGVLDGDPPYGFGKILRTLIIWNETCVLRLESPIAVDAGDHANGNDNAWYSWHMF